MRCKFQTNHKIYKDLGKVGMNLRFFRGNKGPGKFKRKFRNYSGRTQPYKGYIFGNLGGIRNKMAADLHRLLGIFSTYSRFHPPCNFPHIKSRIFYVHSKTSRLYSLHKFLHFYKKYILAGKFYMKPSKNLYNSQYFDNLMSKCLLMVSEKILKNRLGTN